MIRLLHLVASSRGGGATHVRDLALGLDSTRFAVQVAMPEDGGNVSRQEFADAGIPFHPVGIASGFSWSALKQIRRLAAGVDIVHVHGARAALFGRLAAASLGTRRPRVVYIIQGLAIPFYPASRRWILQALERVLAPVTDRMIAVSNEERQAFLSQHIVPPERVKVVQNSVLVAPFQDAECERTAMRAAFGMPENAILITTICRLFKPRDVETILLAFSRAADDARLHLLIVGDGPDRPQIETQVHRLGLDTRVTLAGQRRDIPSILAATDIFTLTTWGWEGLPFTILEAMAAARPVVATRAGGIPEAVVEGETGLLVPRKDPAALTAAWKQLADDVGLRARMGSAGRQRARLEFSRQRMIERTTAVYTEVVSAGSK